MRISKDNMIERDAFARAAFRKNKHLTVYDVDEMIKKRFGVGMNLLRLRLIRNRKNPANYRGTEAVYQVSADHIPDPGPEPAKREHRKPKTQSITDMVRQIVREELKHIFNRMTRLL